MYSKNISPRSIAVTGGKGGVGKTSIALNLSLTLARSGRRVMLIDGDLGLGNIDILLGLRPTVNLWHALQGKCGLEEVVLDGPYGMRVVPAASGITQMTDLSQQQQSDLIKAVHGLADGYDDLIIDTAAGISHQVISFALAVEHIFVVLMNEPTAMTDAYGLVKVLSQGHCRRRFELIANQVDTPEVGRKLYGQFCDTTDRYLDVSIGYLGDIPHDVHLGRAARACEPLVDLSPHSPSARAIVAIAERLRALDTAVCA